MRQFISSTLPDKKGCVSLSSKEAHYLKSVLRIKEGEKLEVRLPDGRLCSMSLSYSSKDFGVKLSFLENLQDSNIVQEISKANFTLFQFLPKGQKMDLIVRQATECGVSVILPIIGDYSIGFKEGKENAHKIERWSRIVREAKQQSGSAVETIVLQPQSINKALEFWTEEHRKGKGDYLSVVLREKGASEGNLFDYFNNGNKEKTQHIGLAVGCEGGISPTELHTLDEFGFLPLHLSTNILRAETAALYGIAVMQTALMEYKRWMELKE